MSHQDEAYLRQNIAAFKGILTAAVPDSVFSFVRHGNAQRESWWLAAVAMTCWGWTTERTLSERVSTACQVVGHVFDRQETVTRQGFLKALRTCGPELVTLMIAALANHVQSLKGYWSHRGKVNVAVDGSKFAAPRTAANQAYFAATGPGRSAAKPAQKKKYKKASDQSKASTVQVLMTVFWHLPSGLPLLWIASASHGSERKNAAQMLDALPRNARMIGDAEYMGDPLWSKIHNSGRSFLVRVGSNLTFLKPLGNHRLDDGYLYYWPEGAMRANNPPLVLRLIRIRQGKQAIFLVTNELDMGEELAWTLYSERGGIEVFFRTVKQTCERAKLHCHRPENVLTELNWTLLGIWYALFAGKQALVKEGRSPQQISPAKVFKAFATVVELISRAATPVRLFQDDLARAVLHDESRRTSRKQSRDYPRKKKHRRCGAPRIKSANAEQRRRIQQLQL